MAQPPRKQKSAAKPAAPAASGVDTALVEQLALIATTHGLAEVEVERAGLRIRVARHGTVAPMQQAYIPSAAPVAHAAPAPAPAPAAAAPATEAANPDHPGAVKSPMVGTAYRRPSPEAKPFVEIGSTVKAGEKILLIEAMKTFNEIVAPRGGVVSAIFVEDGQPVEFGEPLLVIE
jgi:acetyl-CoA carboxylase biotin carboxyl carrier protein